MKLSYPRLRHENPKLTPYSLEIGDFFLKLYISIKALIPMKKWPAFYWMILMVFPNLIMGQVPQKDKSQTLTTEYVALIDLLEEGEHYEIEMITSGCFDQTKETLTISREGNSFKALLNGEQALLNLDQIQAVRDFEINLRNVEGGTCTTTETYIIKFRSETLQFSDASCANWFGKHLKENLGFSI